jgi:diguanylate cyclase (GGDEF)-like protein
MGLSNTHQAGSGRRSVLDKIVRGKPWLPVVNQGATYLGLAMIAFIWLGVDFHVKSERATVQEDAIQHASNLSRAFEEHLVTTLTDLDHTLQVVRSAYERNPDKFDLIEWARQEHALADPAFQLVLIGADGLMKSTTVAQRFAPVDLSDREHFRVHINAQDDKLFISKPLVGRVTGRMSIQLSRRISTPEGGFAGVVVISLDPGHFTRLYDSIDIGREGAIRVVGTDGVVRAIGSQGSHQGAYIGTNLTGSTLLTHASLRPAGWYLTPSSRSDRVGRLVFYRAVRDFPLIVSVGLGTSEMFAGVNAKRTDYDIVASGLTVLILIVVGLSIRDRMTLERASRQLRLQNVRFDAALNNMSHGLAMVDAEKKLVVCNSAYAQMFQLAPEEVQPGTPLDRLVGSKIAKGCLPPVTPSEFAEDRQSIPAKIEHLPDNRDLLVLSQSMSDGGWVTTYEDVTERLRTEARIAHMARHDGLTDLPNRRHFLEELASATAQLQKSEPHFSVFMLDLDGFKLINDTLGHGAGDGLLRAVADRLRFCVRQDDIVARLGGDEFAILQRCAIDQKSEAVGLAADIIEVLSEPFDVGAREVCISTSIGIAMAPEQGRNSEELLSNADLALYQSKLSGRDRYCLFEPAMEKRSRQRSALQNDLRQALQKNEFELHYQPIFDIATERCCGVEALLRWRRGHKELVPPDEFIPIAEDTGLISSIGEWVLRTACRDARAWPANVSLAVNLSPVQFGKGDLAAVVSAVLAATGFPAARLELEITESTLLERTDCNVRTLKELKGLGAKIVLDDFGTGYSSLTYLASFAFDKVKIDRSFIAAMTDRPDCATIVNSIINLVRGLGLRTVAEGVETEDQLRLLRAVGCCEAQGYLLGRPNPVENLTAFHRALKVAS